MPALGSYADAMFGNNFYRNDLVSTEIEVRETKKMKRWSLLEHNIYQVQPGSFVELRLWSAGPLLV